MGTEVDDRFSYCFFARYSALPIWLAWDTFGIANGCESLEELRDRIARLRRGIGYRPEVGRDEIGCILLVHPVFFREGEWITQPSDWKRTTVRSDTYDLSVGEGARVWAECAERAPIVDVHAGLAAEASGESDSPRFGGRMARPAKFGEVRWHGSTIMCDENSTVVRRQREHLQIVSTFVKPRFDGRPEIDRRLTPQDRRHDPLVQVVVGLKPWLHGRRAAASRRSASSL